MNLEGYRIGLQDLMKETVPFLLHKVLDTGFSVDAMICVTPNRGSAFVLKLEETVEGASDRNDSDVANGDASDDTNDSNHDANDTDDANDSLDDSSDANDTTDEADANDVHQCDISVKTEPESINDDTNKIDESVAQEHGDLVTVKQEPPDDDAPLAPADPSLADDMAPDDTAPDDTAPDDTAPDVSNAFGGSSSWNQSSATNGGRASGSRQVRDLLLLIDFFPEIIQLLLKYSVVILKELL